MARRIDITDQIKAFGNFELSNARVRIDVDKVLTLVARASTNVDRESNDGPIRVNVPASTPRLEARRDGSERYLVAPSVPEAKAEKLPQ